MGKFKVGDKVKIPTRKSTCISLEECSLMCDLPEGRNFVYVTRMGSGGVELGIEIGMYNSYFSESDLELYNGENEYEIY